MSFAEVGNWASVVSAVAAAIALAFNALALAMQQRSNDATTLFSVVAGIRDTEMRLIAATADRSAFSIELNNYLNLLETLAAAVNHRLFGASTRRIATDRIITDLGMLLSDTAIGLHIEAAMTSNDTFRELVSFSRRHQIRITNSISCASECPPSASVREGGAPK